MKTPEELNALKNEVDTLNKKLAELSEEELEQVTGGNAVASTPVSASQTTCLYSSFTSRGYDPIDVNKPQSCGNCRSYNSTKGECFEGTTHSQKVFY